MKQPTCLLVWAWALGLMSANELHAVTSEQFESPATTWQVRDADGSVRTLVHERLFAGAHAGQGCEHLRLHAGPATYIHVTHPVTPVRIIDELVPGLWLKSNRPKLRLLARAVLPRAKHPRTGETLTILLDGDFYTQTSGWQQLQVRNINTLLDEQVRILRVAHAPATVDEREAYIDHLVINAYAGPGVTDLFVDDLELVGHAAISTALDQPSAPTWAASLDAAAGRGGAGPTARAEVRGNVLLVDGRPFFPKILEHNGEPFPWLKEAGFNAVLLRMPPSHTQLAAAAEADLWLVAPPPVSNGQLELTLEHGRVLAWWLGELHSDADAAAAASLSTLVRRQDPQTGRPIFCGVDRGLATMQGVVDGVALGRRVLGTSFELSRYGDWLRQQVLAMPQQPAWVMLPTEPSVRLTEQLGLARTNPPLLCADPEQMRLLAFESVAVGARGLCFRSRRRLDLEDDTTRLRAAALRLLNAELTLIEPWGAGGAYQEELDVSGRAGDVSPLILPVSPLMTPEESGASQPPLARMRVRVLETDRSRLLIAIRHAVGEQYVPGPRVNTNASITAHAIPLTDQAYRVTSERLEPLFASRSGRPMIEIRDSDPLSLVLLTQEQLVVNRVARDLAAWQQRAPRLQRELAQLLLRQTELTYVRLVELGQRNEHSQVLLDESRAALERAEHLNQPQSARDLIEQAVAGLRQLQRETWEQAVWSFPSPAASPLCSSFAVLPLHWQAARHLEVGQWGANRLDGGGFESLDALLRSGWQYHRPTAPATDTLVELAVQEPAAGRSCLHLVSRATNSAGADAATRESSDWPVRVTSALVPVRAGQVIRVHAWVKVPAPLADSQDGLLIFDSLGGEELAERVLQTDGWRECTLYRVAPAAGELSITMALTGSGEAWIDDMSVSVLE